MATLASEVLSDYGIIGSLQGEEEEETAYGFSHFKVPTLSAH